VTRSTLGAALLGAALLTGLAACGAGQITQTDVQVAVVPGVNVNSADGQIALRDGMIDYAPTYQVGQPIPIEVRLFNNSHQAAQLTGVRVTDNTFHGTVLLVGGPTPTPSPTTPSPTPSTPPSGAPSGSAVASASASPTPSPTPSAIGAAQFTVPIGVGGVAVLTKTGGTYLAITDTSAPLIAGRTVSTELTFSYEDGTTTTMTDVDLPVTPPLSAIPRPSASE
jgi:hypothetical protein